MDKFIVWKKVGDIQQIGKRTFVFVILKSTITSSILGKTIYYCYMLYFSPVYGIQCLGRKLWKIVLPRDFMWTPSMIQWIVKTCEVLNRFLRKFLDFKVDILTATAVRMMFLYFFEIPMSAFFGKGRIKPFVYFALMFCLCTVLHNWINISLNALLFYTTGCIPSKPVVFYDHKRSYSLH